MIFVDTSGFVAVENRRDANHEKALRFKNTALKFGESFVTSDYVMDECLTLLRIRFGHNVAVSFGEAMLSSQLLRIERVNEEIFDSAWNVFKKYKEQSFSFTDCTSFALMEHSGITTAFTFDDDFKTYGKFLIKPAP